MEKQPVNSPLVIDTSALLAVFFNEAHGEWAKQQLESASTLAMSTINLAETLIHLRDRQPTQHKMLEQRLATSSIVFIPPDAAQASIAATARLNIKALNFGDCFAYALAKTHNAALLTLDSDFKKADITLRMPGYSKP